MKRPDHVSAQPLAAVVSPCPLQYAQISVSGISADNRTILPGDIFAALPGEHVHGARFASAAYLAGAVAVLTDTAGASLITEDIPVIVVDHPAREVGPIASRIYGNPAGKLTTYAITGTNGKTTTAFMIDHILRALGEKTGLIGTVATRIADEEIPAELTTPQPAELQALLATMVERGVTSLVMEASSHALAQGRVAGMEFDVVGFTNLTQDHLDYHNNLDKYFAAKAQLFTAEYSRSGVVVADTHWGQELVQGRPDALVGLTTKTDYPGMWKVSDRQGSTFTLTAPDGDKLQTTCALPGTFNIDNAALAIAMVAQNGYPLADISTALEVADGVSPVVPGRMEIIATEPRIVVDFAHNADALTQAIGALRSTTLGKLIVITGSAGDRDVTKRPEMAAAVAQRADRLVITDDDPHSEDPVVIRKQLIAGIPQSASWCEIPDRVTAITDIIRAARPTDTILIAGRGHEQFQDVNGTMIPLDDREVARAAYAQWKATQ